MTSLVKLAASDYYLRNRDAILRKNKQYRLANKDRIRKRQRRRSRLIRAGARVPVKRVKVGNSYVVVGVSGSASAPPEDSGVDVTYEKRV